MSDDVKDLLRESGLRVTTRRVVVLQALRDGQGHLSADDVYRAALTHLGDVNMVTVYRTLESLEAHGLAARVELGDRLTRWEWIGNAHHHLVCRRCGAVVELDDEPFQRLAAELARSRAVYADVRHLAIHGLCAACVAANGRADATANG